MTTTDTASDATIEVDAGQLLTLNDVRIYGGTINDFSVVSGSIISGAIDVTGSSLIRSASSLCSAASVSCVAGILTA